ncbi:cytochrome c biogenesis protein ResB [bacterium]|nr:cytochrome c biogenesis protein ResB [bacterium]MBU1881330.1 cytochrome c biogenesis protein ResB [bacterium]
MKFAVIILLILAIVSVLTLFIGEFYPVTEFGPNWQDYWSQELGWNDWVFNFCLFLELHDPYRAWWYQLLLATLSLSLLACIIERLPMALKAMKVPATRNGIGVKGLQSSASFTTNRTAEEIAAQLPARYRYQQDKSNGETRIAGIRGGLAHLGPIIAHSGLLLLAVGGLFGSWMGFGTRVSGLPGDVVTHPDFGFDVRIDTFKIEYYPLGLGQYVLVDDSFIGRIVSREGNDKFMLETRGPDQKMASMSVESSRLRNKYDIQMDRGNIKDYITEATVLIDSIPVDSFSIEVNHPLRFGGFRFYQTSFDTENPRVSGSIDSAYVQILKLPDNTPVDTVTIQPQIPLTLSDGNQLTLARFLPDFRLTQSGAVSASVELRNPALRMEVSSPDSVLYYQWTFLKNPFQHNLPEAAYSFQVLHIFGFQGRAVYPTILEVKKNPGTSLIWAGFILGTLGMMFAFYFVTSRLWCVIRKREQGDYEVIIGGSAPKNRAIFERCFQRWVKKLEAL